MTIPLRLTREKLLNVQNKILASKTSICALRYIKGKFSAYYSHFYGVSIQWHLVHDFSFACISQSLREHRF